MSFDVAEEALAHRSYARFRIYLSRSFDFAFRGLLNDI